MKLQKEIEAMLRAILYPKSHICIVYPNDHEAKKCFGDCKRVIKNNINTLKTEINRIDSPVIHFKNGSSIEIISPKKREDNIRGKRAEMKHWMFDYEAFSINEEELDKILQPYLNQDKSK